MNTKISILGNGKGILKPKNSTFVGVEHLTKKSKQHKNSDILLSSEEHENNRKEQAKMRAWCRTQGLKFTTAKI